MEQAKNAKAKALKLSKEKGVQHRAMHVPLDERLNAAKAHAADQARHLKLAKTARGY